MYTYIHTHTYKQKYNNRTEKIDLDIWVFRELEDILDPNNQILNNDRREYENLQFLCTFSC